ncbi:MAG: aldo/keto reductase [Hyphomonadaceae bacterium]|nr:aldo/keto reductase [Hyphomonadaceae bacterium]
MRYRVLGRTGLYVSELSLGAMTFGGGDFWRAIGELDVEAAGPILSRAVDAGVNLIDTADVYAHGRSEEIVGAAIRALGLPRHDLILATKAHERTGPGPNAGGSTLRHLMWSVEQSLKRLRVDHIDLFQLHGVDPVTPPEEIVDALAAIVRSGKVRHVGLCNHPGWRAERLMAIAERRGAPRFAANQIYYSLAGRDAEREVIAHAETAGLGILVWSPLAGGLLSGKFDPLSMGDGPADARRTAFDFPPVDRVRAAAVIAAARPIAAAHQVSVARLALAWLLTRPAVASVIVGAKRVEQLEDNLGAVELAHALTTDQRALLDEASQLPEEYPGWMVAYQAAARTPGGERPNA